MQQKSEEVSLRQCFDSSILTVLSNKTENYNLFLRVCGLCVVSMQGMPQMHLGDKMQFSCKLFISHSLTLT